MIDPIETLVQLTGETATLVLQPSSNFDPRAATDWAPGTPISLPMTVVYQKAPESGEATTRTARVMFTDNPFSAPYSAYRFQQVEDAAVIMNGVFEVGRVQSAKTRLLSRGTDYIVNVARARFYLGVMNGFTMELQR